MTTTKASARPQPKEDAWETRELGASLEHAQVSSAERSHALDDALGMQAISIRLPKQLIDQYKMIAQYHGVGYQPLMRDILARYVPHAMQEMMTDLEAQLEKAKAEAEKIEQSGMRKAA
jgi:predicted DNA binding CopG/RHH family protein